MNNDSERYYTIEEALAIINGIDHRSRQYRITRMIIALIIGFLFGRIIGILGG